jgi:hypothetical protein
MPKQKYHRGDMVHIAQDLGASMRHFECDQRVVIIGSYCDQFHSHGRPMIHLPERSIAPVADYTVPFDQPEDCCEPNGHSYTVLFDDGGECSWYWEYQLRFIEHGGEQEIERIRANRAAREQAEVKLENIVANWRIIRDNPPSYIMNFLMGLVGITEPWGSQGEGLAYAANWRQTFKLVDPILLDGSIDTAFEFFKTARPLKTMDVRFHEEE